MEFESVKDFETNCPLSLKHATLTFFSIENGLIYYVGQYNRIILTCAIRENENKEYFYKLTEMLENLLHASEVIIRLNGDQLLAVHDF